MRKLFLSMLVLAAQCYGTATFVRMTECSGNGSSGTIASASCSFATLPAVGNLVVILGGSRTSTIGTVSDNQGNTYTSIVDSGYHYPTQVAIYGTLVTTSAGTFTVTMTNGIATVIAEFSGFSGPLTVDVSASTFFGSPGTSPFTFTCGSGLTTSVNDLLLTGFVGPDNTNIQVNSIGSGFPFVIPPATGYRNPLTLGFSYNALGAGTYHPDFTMSPNYNVADGQYVCAAIKEVGGGSSSTTIRHRVIVQ